MNSICVGCGCVLPPDESSAVTLCEDCDSLRREPQGEEPVGPEDLRSSPTSDPQDDVQIRLKALQEILLRHSGRPTV